MESLTPREDTALSFRGAFLLGLLPEESDTRNLLAALCVRFLPDCTPETGDLLAEEVLLHTALFLDHEAAARNAGPEHYLKGMLEEVLEDLTPAERDRALELALALASPLASSPARARAPLPDDVLQEARAAMGTFASRSSLPPTISPADLTALGAMQTRPGTVPLQALSTMSLYTMAMAGEVSGPAHTLTLEELSFNVCLHLHAIRVQAARHQGLLTRSACSLRLSALWAARFVLLLSSALADGLPAVFFRCNRTEALAGIALSRELAERNCVPFQTRMWTMAQGAEIPLPKLRCTLPELSVPASDLLEQRREASAGASSGLYTPESPILPTEETEPASNPR